MTGKKNELKTKIENVEITNTFLGYEDHGILTFLIGIQGCSGGVHIGGYALDSYSKEKGEKIAYSKSMQVVTEILKVVGVRNWESLKGQYIRVETHGFGQKVTKIGHLIEDRWFDFEEFFKEENKKVEEHSDGKDEIKEKKENKAGTKESSGERNAESK